MSKKNIPIIFWLIMVYSCTSKEEQEYNKKYIQAQKEVFSELIPNLLDSLVNEHNTASNIFINYEIYPDQVKSNSIKEFLAAYENSKSLKLSLSRKLIKNLNDTVLVWNIKSPTIYFLVGDEADSLLENNLPFFAQINLSNIEFNEELTSGVFYFAYQCGSDCGEGCIIFIKKSSNNNESWLIEQKLPIWM